MRRHLASITAVIVLTACSPKEDPMSAEDYRKPENSGALARMIERCNASIIPDTKSPGCQAAFEAKWKIEVEETRAARSGQGSSREDVTGSTRPAR